MVLAEETFGSIAPVFSFAIAEEVIKMAKETEYGLASYFYSKDVSRCWRVEEELENSWNK
jgi:succinate-semialdehyde dehydrogenase/glutarate-semialdehyde dehydrogenase